MARNVALVVVLVALGAGIGLYIANSRDNKIVPDVPANEITENAKSETKKTADPVVEPEKEKPVRKDPAPVKESKKDPVVAPPAANIKVAVVNLKECFKGDRYEWVKLVDEELAVIAEGGAKERENLRKEIRDTQERIKGLPETSKLRLEMVKKFRILEARLKVAQEMGKVEYLNLYTEKKTDVYNEIVRVTSLVARDMGLDLVLRVEEAALDPDARFSESVTAKINRKAVIYHTATIDITDKVIEKLNEEYRKRPKKGPDGGKMFECLSCGADHVKPMKEADAIKQNQKCLRCGKPLTEKK